MSQFKISTRLAGLLTALCLLVLLVGGGGLFGMGQSNAGLKSVYDDRVVPLKQIKVVADMYAVNIVDASTPIDHRDVFFSPEERHEGQKMCACVSRAVGGTVTIDTGYRQEALRA